MAKPPRQYLANHASGPRYETLETADLQKTAAVVGEGASVPGHLPVFTDYAARRIGDSGYSIADIISLASSIFTIFTDNPVSPLENDTAFLFRDQGSPETLYLRATIGGTTYDIPLFTLP